jgi:hypothetical protein
MCRLHASTPVLAFGSDAGFLPYFTVHFTSLMKLISRCAVGGHVQEQAFESAGVLDGVGVVVVVEVGVDAAGAGQAERLGPGFEFPFRVVVPVPPLRTVETDIEVRGGLHERVGEARATGRTEDDAALRCGARRADRGDRVVVPPTAVAELQDVGPAGVELVEDAAEAGRGVTEAGGIWNRNAPRWCSSVSPSAQNSRISRLAPVNRLSCVIRPLTLTAYTKLRWASRFQRRTVSGFGQR